MGGPLSWAADPIARLPAHNFAFQDVPTQYVDLLRENAIRTMSAHKNIHQRKAVVQLLLAKNDVNVELTDSDGQTPLSYAAAKGHEAIVQLLVEAGKVDVDGKDKDGRTPLS
jgi:ankyrin repeat protein